MTAQEWADSWYNAGAVFPFVFRHLMWILVGAGGCRALLIWFPGAR